MSIERKEEGNSSPRIRRGRITWHSTTTIQKNGIFADAIPLSKSRSTVSDFSHTHKRMSVNKKGRVRSSSDPGSVQGMVDTEVSGDKAPASSVVELVGCSKHL